MIPQKVKEKGFGGASSSPLWYSKNESCSQKSHVVAKIIDNDIA